MSSLTHYTPPAIIAPAVDEFVAAINELEAQADAAETQPSEIRWEQARQLAAQPHWTVLYVAGEAADSSPWYIQHLGGTAVKDLTGISSPEHRREVLHVMFHTWAQWVEAKL